MKVYVIVKILESRMYGFVTQHKRKEVDFVNEGEGGTGSEVVVCIAVAGRGVCALRESRLCSTTVWKHIRARRRQLKRGENANG